MVDRASGHKHNEIIIEISIEIFEGQQFIVESQIFRNFLTYLRFLMKPGTKVGYAKDIHLICEVLDEPTKSFKCNETLFKDKNLSQRSLPD